MKSAKYIPLKANISAIYAVTLANSFWPRSLRSTHSHNLINSWGGECSMKSARPELVRVLAPCFGYCSSFNYHYLALRLVFISWAELLL